MKVKKLFLVSLGVVGLNMIHVFAEENHDDHHKDQVPSEISDVAMSEGEIKKIDKDQGKLTIKHGELKNLGMPPMTMSFRVSNPDILNEFKVGQKVKFFAENVNGVLTVTKIEKF